jgi:hypothetical protein
MTKRNRIWGAFVLSALIAAVAFFGFGFAEPPVTPPDMPPNAYMPAQPIAYSHKLHAGDLQIPCEFCHTYAGRSRSAGIPAMEQCMACHKLMATDRPMVQQLRDAWEAKTPIEWVKVHDLPDFVYFSHQRHVKAGFACQQCHGPVETMEVVWRQAPLTMGWCVSCHEDNRDKGASTDCLVCHK